MTQKFDGDKQPVGFKLSTGSAEGLLRSLELCLAFGLGQCLVLMMSQWMEKSVQIKFAFEVSSCKVQRFTYISLI